MEINKKSKTQQQCSFDKFKEELEVPVFEGTRIGRRGVGRLNLLGVYAIYSRYKKFSVTKAPRSAIKIGKPHQMMIKSLPENHRLAWERVVTWNRNGLIDRVDFVNYMVIQMCVYNFSFLDIPNKPEDVLAELERFESKNAFDRSKEFMDDGMKMKEYLLSPEGRKYKDDPVGFMVSDKFNQSFALTALETNYINLAFYRKMAMETHHKMDMSKVHPRDAHFHKMLGVMHDDRMPDFLKKSR